VGELENLASFAETVTVELNTKCAIARCFFCAGAIWLVDGEWLSPDCLQSNKQQRLDAIDSFPLLCAARQQEAEHPTSLSKWGLTPARELTPTEAMKLSINSSFAIKL
jgi:hypothetical protein